MATVINDRDLQLAGTSPRVAGVTLASNITVPGLAGAITSSKFVELSATSQIFQIPKVGSISPTGITVTANIHNLVNTPTLTIPSGGGTMSVTPVLTGGTFTFTPAQMTSDTVTLLLTVVEASITYTDTMTFVKCREGIDSINVILTNENVTLPGDTSGNVLSYAGATGNIKVYQGINDVTSVCTFALASGGNPSSLTFSLNAGPGGSGGAYAVTAGYPSGTSLTTLTFNATFGTTVVSKVFTLSKANAGATGTRGSVQLSVALGGSTAVWSDATAAAAVVSTTGSSPIRLDQVTEVNNSVNFVQTKVFDGTNWQVASVAIDGNLIVNGTIVAGALSVNAVTSSSLASITMTVGKFIQSTSFVSGTSGWQINANGTAEFGAASIRGQLVASQINANGLSIYSATGTLILNAGQPLANQIIAGSGNMYKNTEFSLTAATVPVGFVVYNNSGISVSSSVTATGGAVGSAAYWRITANAGGATTFGYLLNGGWAGWANNTDYVWSYYARVSAGSSLIGSTMIDAWNHGPATSTFIQNPALTTSWQRYVLLVNFGSNTLDANGFVKTQTLPITGDSLDISCVQIETGGSASGWAPLQYVDSSGTLRGSPAGSSPVAVDNSLSLSKASNSVLSATVSINSVTGAGFVAGSLTWDSAGAVTNGGSGGKGVAMTPGGLVGYSNPTGTAAVKTFSIDATTGNAFFGGTLKVGTASNGSVTNSVHGFTNTPGGSPGISNTNNAIVTTTTSGGDVQILLNLNVTVMTNTNTPVVIEITPYIDSALYSVPLPAYELTMTNSSPMVRFISGQTAYAWGVTVPFSLNFTAPALAAGSHTFGCMVSAGYYTNVAGPNTITGSSISFIGSMSVRDFVA